MTLRQVSGIARPLELGYPTNRWIGVLTLMVLIAGAITRLLAGDGWLAATGWSALAALAFFLAWALARELDPDAELAAFVAAGFMLPALAASGLGWLPLPDLAALRSQGSIRSLAPTHHSEVSGCVICNAGCRSSWSPTRFNHHR